MLGNNRLSVSSNTIFSIMESTNGIGNDSLLALNENTRSRSGGLLSSGNENDSNNGSISCDDNEDFDDEDVDEQREEIEGD